MKKYILYIALCLVVAVSCEQLPDDVKIYGVGCKADKVELIANAGEYTLEVFANGEFTATLDEDDTWLRFAGYGDSREIVCNSTETTSLKMSFDINKGVLRTSVLILTRGTNMFKVTFVQNGIIEGGVAVEQKNISAKPEGGSYAVKVITKLKEDDMDFLVDCGEETAWITNFRLKNNFICFDVKPNPNALTRHAVITVKYYGAEGHIHVSQPYGGYTNETMTVETLKGLLTSEAEYVFEDNIVLSGVVINDHLQKNGAENRMVSHDVQDLTYAERILYVQNEAGNSGIKLVFKESCADVISRFDRISVELNGLKLKRENDPVRYSISDIPVTSIIESMAGDAPSLAPISLNDVESSLNDVENNRLYTLVTVKDIEIPVRKGSYAPIDVRYVGIMTSYPMVIRDIEGSTSHMMVNLDCPWSRNGKTLPRGSGSLTGVVVHETCDNFEWDPAAEDKLKETVDPTSITGLGKIGKYQIRPVCQEDIKLDNPAFSTLMYEWAYCDTLGVNLVANYADSTLFPSFSELEEGTDPQKFNAKFYCIDEGDTPHKTKLMHCNDYTNLGPYEFGGYITDHNNGNGIYDYLGRSAHWYTKQGGEKYGVLYSTELGYRWTIDNGACWCVKDWRKTKYWCIEFSIEELTAANKPLSLTFGTLATILTGPGSPRYWEVQWSDDSVSWEHVCDYTVPDFVKSGNMHVFQMPGIKYITVTLPDEVFDNDKVYVRLIPKADSKAGTTSSYYGGSVKEAAHNAINYVAIRCNK